MGIEFEHQRIPGNRQTIAHSQLSWSDIKAVLRAEITSAFEKIIVELKAVSFLTDEHRAQLLNYLHATGFEARSARKLWPLPGLGIRTHCENAAHKSETPIFPMFLCDLFALIRVIRGLIRMTPARFQTIEEIFLAALEQEPDQLAHSWTRPAKAMRFCGVKLKCFSLQINEQAGL